MAGTGSQCGLQGEDGWAGGEVAGCAEQAPPGEGAAGRGRETPLTWLLP